LFDDSLVIKIEPEKIKSLHNIVLDSFISEIVLKGNVLAIENKELFDKRYLFVGDKYAPHMTVAKGIFSGNVLENIEQIINSNNTNYNFKLVLSRKDKSSWKNISEV
jgi:hypothetical protein